MKRNMPKLPFPVLQRVILACVFALAGCRFTQEPPAPILPLSQKVRWSGGLAVSYADSLVATEDSLQTGKAFRIHDFGFSDPDSTRLRLFEFAQAFGAYAAYQHAAGPEEIAESHFRQGPQGSKWRFHHDRFFGELTSQRVQPQGDELIDNLSFQGEALFLKPKEFEAFPLLGRIPHSERVIADHFLGRAWRGPVFTVAYRCHGDTATAFRAFAQESGLLEEWMSAWKGEMDSLDWGREIHFQGQDEFRRPLIFWKFSEAVMGFAGCSDTILALKYAEKMKKTAILWPKP
jgi:hypothetical protein